MEGGHALAVRMCKRRNVKSIFHSYAYKIQIQEPCIDTPTANSKHFWIVDKWVCLVRTQATVLLILLVEVSGVRKYVM